MPARSGAAPWVGVAVILLYAIVCLVVLPRVAASVSADQAVASGDEVTVAGVTAVPVGDWAVPPDVTDELVLRSGGAQITVFPPSPDAGSLDDQAAAAADALTGDTETDWQVTGPESFTTDAGEEGMVVVGHLPTEFTATYLVPDGDQVLNVLVSGTDDDWTSLADDIDETVQSLTIEGGSS